MKKSSKKVVFFSFIMVIAIAGLSIGAFLLEVRFSFLQSRFFYSQIREMCYYTADGKCNAAFPESGPYDERLGYTSMPKILKKLEKEGGVVKRQACWTTALSKLWRERGISPPYREKTSAGLKIYDKKGKLIYKASHPKNVFGTLKDVPELIAKALAAIENKEILSSEPKTTKNPVIEWRRLLKSIFNSLLKKIGFPKKIYGASTLATQLEKFRHSPKGMTDSVQEKFRQMLGASYRAYMYGKNTSWRREEIILDYINSLPLGGIKGFGEVIGLSDGLEAYYGLSPREARRCLKKRNPLCLKQAVSLLIAQRRPYYYLVENHSALNRLTNKYLFVLAKEGVISASLAKMAASKAVIPRKSVETEQKAIDKGVDAIRYYLIDLLGLKSLYELDRMDLSVYSTLDIGVQRKIEEKLKAIATPKGAKEAGLLRYPLIGKNDPSALIYSVSVWKQTDDFNCMVVNADTYQHRLNLNEGMRLELGSTAKLRTLVSYLQIVESLYEKWESKPKNELLQQAHQAGRDNIKRWAAQYLASKKSTPSLKEFLDASLERKYTASPYEVFFTGGGIHTFSNYKKEENGRVPTVKNALWKSTNLVFIRLMRDVIAHLTTELKEREENYYIDGFVDKESVVFLRQAYDDYRNKKPEEIVSDLMTRIKGNPFKIAVMFRLLWPKKNIGDYLEFLQKQGITTDRSEKLRRDFEGLASKPNKDGRPTVGGFDWQDYGYLLKIHPLRVWLGARIIARGHSSFGELIRESSRVRKEVYRWLYKTSFQRARQKRINIMREEAAFETLRQMWGKVGFPFSHLQPSLATAIGSSGDRPNALVRLLGIILSGGADYQRSRITQIRFAKGTPYETIVVFQAKKPKRVISREVADAAKETLTGVVKVGTARALNDLFDGKIMMGGKTGTGDNRRETYTERGKVITSKAINRTATFVFFASDIIGAITAHVPGEKSDKYNFTSALPVQLVKLFEDELSVLVFK